MSIKQLSCCALLIIATTCRTGFALDEELIEGFLKRPIIGSERTLTEVQTYTESRVLRMPNVNSADEWTKIASEIRQNVLSNVVLRGEAEQWQQSKTTARWLDEIKTDKGYTIKKLRYEAVPGLWIPALLYEPAKLNGRVPVVMNVNGHDREGKAADYKQTRCIHLAKNGIICLNVEWLGMGQLRGPKMSHYAMNQLDLCGTSGLAPFYLSMKRGLDILLEHPYADPKRVGVAGLSGGGWQTIFISSLDTRVTLSNPVAGYSSFITRARHFKDLGDSEQTPSDLAVYADYTHLTAMLAPRAGLLTFNKTDNCCFESTYALEPLLEAARPIYRLYDRMDRIRSHVNVDPGTHNFGQDNREALYAVVRDEFHAGDAAFHTREADYKDELKTKEELNVAMPADNATFNSLAVHLAKSLPVESTLPRDRGPANQWQQDAIRRLNEVIRSDSAKYDVVATAADQFTREGVRIAFWRINVGGDWTVPATEFSPPDAVATTIVISDTGRATCASDVSRLIETKQRVLAVDPFYFGESKVSQKAHLFAFMIATVGHRPLGVQANQIAAIARWARQNREDHAVSLVARGQRTSLIGLVAAAIETRAISRVELHDSLGSFKEVIESNRLADSVPEMYCFGLLKQFDVLQLAAMIAPRPVVFHKPTDRARLELKSLARWFETMGVNHDPLASSKSD